VLRAKMGVYHRNTILFGSSRTELNERDTRRHEGPLVGANSECKQATVLLWYAVPHKRAFDWPKSSEDRTR